VPQSLIDPSLAQAAPVTQVGMPRQGFGKTLALMREELRLGLGGRSDVTAERLDSWINDAYADLVSSLQLDEMKGSLRLDTAEGQHLYLLPETVGTLLSVSIQRSWNYSLQDGYNLDKIDLQTFREMRFLGGPPMSYFRQGQVLVLWPAPSIEHVITVDFRVTPAPLVNDEDSPFIGVEWHRAILLNAKSLAFEDLLEPERATIAENRFVAYVRRRRDKEADEDENRIVGSSVPRKLSELRRSIRKSIFRED